MKYRLLGALGALLTLGILSPAFAAGFSTPAHSGCFDVTVKHSILPVEKFFAGPKVALAIHGFTGTYNKGFIDYLKDNPMWGLADNGKYIGYLVTPRQDTGGKTWQVSDSAAPEAAPDQFDNSAELGVLYQTYLAHGYGLVAVHDESRFPFHQWITLPEYSGSKKYIILDWAAENNDSLVVIYEPGPYRGADVSASTLCFAQRP